MPRAETPSERGLIRRPFQATLRAEFERRGPAGLYEVAEALKVEPAAVRALLADGARVSQLLHEVVDHLGMRGTPFMAVDLDQDELEELWPKLDERARRAVLALARSLAEGSGR